MCCHYMSVYYKPLLFIFMSFSIFFPLRLIRIFFPLFLLPEQYQFHCLSFYYSNVFQIVLLICMNATNDKQRSNITKHFGKFLSKQITQKYFCNIILHGVCLYLKWNLFFSCRSHLVLCYIFNNGIMTHEKNKKKKNKKRIPHPKWSLWGNWTTKKTKQTIRDENEWREKNMPRE